MSGRDLVWFGGFVAGTAFSGLLLFFAVRGVDWGGAVGGIGVVGIGGLLLAVYGAIRSWRNTQVSDDQLGRDLVTGETPVLRQEAVQAVAELPAPPELVNLPAPPQTFVGRSSEFAELEAALAAPGVVVVAAAHGLGGIGKAALAARHASDAAHGGTNPVWWITAHTAAAVQAGLADLAAALQPERKAELGMQALAERGSAWLAGHQGWLLVLDDVTDPVDIAPVTDHATQGRILITSRLAQGWDRFGARVLTLDVLSRERAVEVLTRGATVDAGVQSGGSALDGADELAAELGHLPLAIELAAAYMRENRLSPRHYLKRLAETPVVPYDHTAAGGDAWTIARVCRVTLDRLTTDTPLAGELLRILAWYAPGPVPRTVLDGLNTLPGWQGSAAPPLVRDALGRLADYGMITLAPDTVTVHRLVQAVARTPADGHYPAGAGDPHRRPEAVTAALYAATRLLDQARPDETDDPAGWPRWRRLLPHIDALIAHAPPDTGDACTSLLLDRTATFLQNQGLSSRAIGYFEFALAADQRLYGTEHPSTLTARNNLAGAYESAGKYDQAVSKYKEALADHERVLGRAHPHTLITSDNFAYASLAAGNPGWAIYLYRRTLDGYERMLGADHPTTLTARGNLANAYQTLGHPGRAISEYERTLAGHERTLGVGHPDTLSSRDNLACAHWAAGRWSRAIAMYEWNLAERERVLGADHPDTLTSRDTLACAYGTAGDLGRAIPLLERTLADHERVLGGDHPDTLVSRYNLACVYGLAGELGRTIPLCERTLAGSERALGADHPDTLSYRHVLAVACGTAGDMARAIPLFERTLADQERVLDNGHLATLVSRYNLAYAYGAVGDSARSIPLYEQTLADCKRMLGRGHSMTRRTRSDLKTAKSRGKGHR